MWLPGWHRAACRAPVSLIPLRMMRSATIRSTGEMKMTTKPVIAPSTDRYAFPARLLHEARNPVQRIRGDGAGRTDCAAFFFHL